MILFNDFPAFSLDFANVENNLASANVSGISYSTDGMTCNSTSNDPYFYSTSTFMQIPPSSLRYIHILCKCNDSGSSQYCQLFFDDYGTGWAGGYSLYSQQALVCDGTWQILTFDAHTDTNSANWLSLASIGNLRFDFAGRTMTGYTIKWCRGYLNGTPEKPLLHFRFDANSGTTEAHVGQASNPATWNTAPTRDFSMYGGTASNTASNYYALHNASSWVKSCRSDFTIWTRCKAPYSTAEMLILQPVSGWGSIIYTSYGGIVFDTAGSDSTSAPSGYTWTDWHHYAVCRRGTTLEYWVDGKLAASKTISNDITRTGNGAETRIGYRANSTFADAGVVPYALSHTELTNLGRLRKKFA